MFEIKNIAFELSFLRIDGIRVRKGLKREQVLRGHNFCPLKQLSHFRGRLQGSSLFRILSFVECFWRFSVIFCVIALQRVLQRTLPPREKVPFCYFSTFSTDGSTSIHRLFKIPHFHYFRFSSLKKNHPNFRVMGIGSPK